MDNAIEYRGCRISVTVGGESPRFVALFTIEIRDAVGEPADRVSRFCDGFFPSEDTALEQAFVVARKVVDLFKDGVLKTW